ncbi:MAG: hypothetical protein WCS65_10500 [Verrucomicrobiae bacterium]
MGREVCGGGRADEDEDREILGLGQSEGHEEPAEGEGDSHPPSRSEPPADVVKFPAIDPSAEDFSITEEACENHKAPEKDGEVGGVHGKRKAETRKSLKLKLERGKWNKP